MGTIYIASGTADYLLRIFKKYPNENLRIFHGDRHSLLIHETDEKTLFQFPKTYQLIANIGIFPYKGKAAIRYVPVLEEFQPVFEYQIRKKMTEELLSFGITSLHLLRPKKGDTYALIACIQKGDSIETCRELFKFLLEEQPGKEKFYPRPGYTEEYVIGEDEDEN